MCTPAAHEFNLPAAASEAASRNNLRRDRRHAPSRRGSGGKLGQVLLGDRPPAPDDQGGNARSLRGHLQATGGGEAEPGDFADDRAQAFLMEALFDERQDVGITAGLGVNDTIRMKADLHEARRKQIAPGQAPEHRPFEAGGNPGREERGGSGKLRSGPSSITSCRAPRISPRPGRCRSSAETPKGRDLREP